MAIKILKEGKVEHREQMYRGECERCHCQIECVEGDLLKGVQLGAGIRKHCVDCPTPDCRGVIYPTKYVTRNLK